LELLACLPRPADLWGRLSVKRNWGTTKQSPALKNIDQGGNRKRKGTRARVDN